MREKAVSISLFFSFEVRVSKKTLAYKDRKKEGQQRSEL